MTSTLLFNPSEKTAAEALHLLTSVNLSLRDIADRFDTTTEALSAWLTRPDIAARLASLESTLYARTRLVAAGHLPQVIAVASRIINNFMADAGGPPLRGGSPPGTSALRADTNPPNPPSDHPTGHASPAPPHAESSPPHPLTSSPAHPPNPTHQLQAEILRCRANEIARRAATLIFRLARILPARTNSSPTHLLTSSPPHPHPSPAATATPQPNTGPNSPARKAMANALISALATPPNSRERTTLLAALESKAPLDSIFPTPPTNEHEESPTHADLETPSEAPIDPPDDPQHNSPNNSQHNTPNDSPPNLSTMSDEELIDYVHANFATNSS